MASETVIRPWIPDDFPAVYAFSPRINVKPTWATKFVNYGFFVITIKSWDLQKESWGATPPHAFAEAISNNLDGEDWGVTTHPLVAQALCSTELFQVQIVRDHPHQKKIQQKPAFLKEKRRIIRHLERIPLLFGWHGLPLRPSQLEIAYIKSLEDDQRFVGITGNVIRWLYQLKCHSHFDPNIQSIPDFLDLFEMICKEQERRMTAFERYFENNDNEKNINEWIRLYGEYPELLRTAYHGMKDPDNAHDRAIVEAFFELATAGTTEMPFEPIRRQAELIIKDPRNQLQAMLQTMPAPAS